MFRSVLRRLRDAQATELEGEAAAEAGFTLIELMVVLLIIAILLAIAIPTFLGVTGSANDRAAQSNLTNALTEAAAVYQGNNQTYSAIAGILTTSAPEFTWLTGASTMSQGTSQISVATVDASSIGDFQGVELANYSKTGTCWYVVELSSAPTALGTTDTANGFARALTGTAVGDETGIASAGTYYAQFTGSNVTAAKCVASYPQTDTAGFKWGTSYSAAGANTA
jgi:type IV pilus assembly protein PilA